MRGVCNLYIVKWISILGQLLLLLVLNKIGNLFVEFTNLPLPGNVMGMLLLFSLLTTGIVRLEWVEAASSLLIKHLSFFFIPISVGLMTLGAVFIKSGISLLFVLVISTLLGILISGSLSQVLIKRKEVIEIEHDYHHL